ncbi:hypothetical protein APHAL10511_001415 [Amanita phalloides]|nr:hypothetical protein APHAL10511_001415 [Amanita phalloides]
MAKQQDDILIAVMGSTGTGKSSFVRLLSGDTSVHVGDSLDSETSDIQLASFRDPESGRNVTIVDTPGFDDSRSGISDTKVLKKIAAFLLETYDNKRKLSGLVYLQRISDPRFGGQSGRNLAMFRNLCGTKAYENVVVLTTFWDKASSEQGDQREEQLKTRFFKDLVEGRARFMRHSLTLESARHVLQHISTLNPTNVQIQEEIRVEGKALEGTAAGCVHREEVERIITEHNKEIQGLKDELEALKNNNSVLKHELEEKRARLERELERLEAERVELKKGLDEAKEAQERMKAEAENERADNEKRRQEQEREQKSRLDQQKRENEERMRRQREELVRQQQAEAAREEARRRAHEEEMRRQQEQLERQRREEAAREEARRRAREEEARRQQEELERRRREEAAREEARRRAQEEAMRRQQEELRRQQQEEAAREAARRRAHEEAMRRQQEELERQRREEAAREEARRRAREEEARRQQEEHDRRQRNVFISDAALLAATPVLGPVGIAAFAVKKLFRF